MKQIVTTICLLVSVLAVVLASGSAPGARSCANRVVGTSGNDTLEGSGKSDRILGLAGRDRLSGEGAGDCLEGGSGADRLDGGQGNDRLNGGGSGDVLEGDNGHDTLDGRAGPDLLSGGAGNDTLDGAAGDDRVREVGDGYREGETVDVGSNRIDTGSGRDTVDAANGRRDRIDCGSSADHVTGDRIDSIKRCERKTFLVSPFPQVSPSAGNRRRSFLVNFRSLGDISRRTEFFSIVVRGPSGSDCRRLISNSIGVPYHRNRVVRYQLRPFSGTGRTAKRWCRGRYRGKASFVQVVKPGCRVRGGGRPDPKCTETRSIGDFSFKVR
ncbi:MAG: calcium-binding protein [Solirubrobacterales bacterium]